MHVAVMRDGVRLVLDDHLRGLPFLAGLHVSTVIVALKSSVRLFVVDSA